MVYTILKVHLALAHLKGIVTKSMFYHACSIFYQMPVERPQYMLLHSSLPSHFLLQINLI